MVIAGWSEGLRMTREGSKAKLYIPSDLAYGENGVGRDIGPNEVIIFEVELIAIVKNPDTPE
jgi:FKBP-type peptidyl-prolyl cis-trans isomerase FkpA/FKBP-type peptidyl-prolyl cis-trans isomerase FklB